MRYSILAVVEGQAHAALKVIQKAKTDEWNSVIFEGDCRQLIVALQDEDSELCPFGAYLEDIAFLCYRLICNLSLAKNEMARLRDENSKRLLRDRKLSLVLDLDHTLLNSAGFSVITDEEEYLNCKRDVLPEYLKSSLFRVDLTETLTKLRPYVNTFLKEASKLYELNIYTMGGFLYALEMAKLLDPENIYFNSRIISRDDSTRVFEKSLDVVLGKENATVILDDSESVWCKEHKENLIKIERYHFFAHSCKRFGVDHKSHSQLKSDENESEGALANSLKILQQIHTLFFDPGQKDSLEDRDLRKVLKSVQKEVVKGCKVGFSDEISD
ncbi:hypothetical protein ABFS83_06G153900 [Erythranthe nasuta]